MEHHQELLVKAKIKRRWEQEVDDGVLKLLGRNDLGAL
jgi:hypothetical protein